MSNLQANVPLVNTPLVDQNGNVTESWFIFLIQLWRRTGGNSDIPTSQLTIADVLALEETFGVSVTDTGSPLTAEVSFAPARANEGFSKDITVATAISADNLQEMVFAPTSQAVIANQTFSSGTDFTPGTTTALTLSNSFASASQIWVFFDGTFQGDDQFSLVKTTLTFTSAIPVGVSKVYVKGLR